MSIHNILNASLVIMKSKMCIVTMNFKLIVITNYHESTYNYFKIRKQFKKMSILILCHIIFLDTNVHQMAYR